MRISGLRSPQKSGTAGPGPSLSLCLSLSFSLIPSLYLPLSFSLSLSLSFFYPLFSSHTSLTFSLSYSIVDLAHLPIHLFIDFHFVIVLCSRPQASSMVNIYDVPGWLKSTDYTGKVGLTVKIYVDPKKIAEFKKFAVEILNTTRKREGSIRFIANRDYERDDVFWFLEEWKRSSWFGQASFVYLPSLNEFSISWINLRKTAPSNSRCRIWNIQDTFKQTGHPRGKGSCPLNRGATKSGAPKSGYDYSLQLSLPCSTLLPRAHYYKIKKKSLNKTKLSCNSCVEVSHVTLFNKFTGFCFAVCIVSWVMPYTDFPVLSASKPDIMSVMENISDVVGWLKSTTYTGKVGLTVKIYVGPTKIAAFKELVSEHLTTSRQEPGVIRFSANRDYQRDDIFWFIEEWESPSALQTKFYRLQETGNTTYHRRGSRPARLHGIQVSERSPSTAVGPRFRDTLGGKALVHYIGVPLNRGPLNRGTTLSLPCSTLLPRAHYYKIKKKSLNKTKLSCNSCVEVSHVTLFNKFTGFCFAVCIVSWVMPYTDFPVLSASKPDMIMSVMENISDVIGWLKSTTYTGKVGLTVKIYVDSTKIAAFKELVSEHLTTSRQEPGVIRFSANRDYQRDDIFWFIEEWESPSALLTHLGTEWFRDGYLVRSRELCVAPGQRALYLMG
eukprot:sb/3462771/